MNELAGASIASPAAAAQPAPPPDAPAAPSAPDAAPAQAPQLPAALAAVQSGKVAAITLGEFNSKDPLHEFVASNFSDLSKMGLDYMDLSGKGNLSVVFNPQLITEAKIDALHKDGKLQSVAPMADDKGLEAAAPAQPAPAQAPAQDGAAAAPEAPPSDTTGGALANASAQVGAAPKPNRGLQDAQARNLQAVNAPPVNRPTGGPSAVLARRAI